MIAYFNGEYCPKESIAISPDDRGFLFADGLYEVIRAYRGRLFRAEDHLERLKAGARSLNLTVQDFAHLKQVAQKLLVKNGLNADATVYFQVTRGAAPRGHAFPDPKVEPTVYGIAAPFDPGPGLKKQETGVPVILVPDQRWARCDLKTCGLTANVLANQRAKESGAGEALFVRDGVILEGTHSNFMAVVDNRLVTAPASNHILHGITRKLVLELAHAEGIPVWEAPVFEADRHKISEAFITGTTTEITPVTAIDSTPVGEGEPGPVTRTLQNALRQVTKKS
ncbi:MAG TPA: D-alanine aminotransferase Dat [Desulfobacteraceae bacterium]|nr:D-alanine aminotransferase Dat [Desulfobacteraceae bacterium]